MSEISTRLADRVAVVTGAAEGLGRAYATRLAREGAEVWIADIADGSATRSAIEADGGRAVVHHCDVTSPDSVERCAAAVHETSGRCDILVNNAGIYPVKSFEETSFAVWRKVMQVNLDGIFLMCRAFLPRMRERGYGRVINIVTTIPWLTVPDFAAYSASKMGVIGLTRALASEYGGHGVTVNAAAPSLVRTATTEAGPQAQMFDAVASMQAIKRIQEPEDMVGTIAFLASDDSAFTTGQTLISDGGLTRL
ncbi:MAG TPA: SDR family oxidoreductase [Solirubrobacteraceae bacterium]|jgi:NAD(P)-dependent dehydrogenase (short-subunit alcohol dehydrogenase family)